MQTGNKLVNHEAEAAVLGAVILDGSLWGEVLELSPEDFDRPRHVLIFRAMQAIHKAGRKVDVVSLTDLLMSRGKLDDAGGHAYLADLMGAVPSTSNLPYYVGIVSDKATARKAVNRLQAAISDLTEGVEPGAAILSAQNDLNKLSASGGTGAITSGQLVEQAVANIQDAHKYRQDHGEQFVPGLRSGLDALDSVIGGFEANYHIIAGETSMGKSAFALGRALHFAVNEKRPGLYVSLEDHVKTMGLRVMAGLSGLDAQDLRFGIMPGIAGWEKLTKAATKLTPAPILWSFDARSLAAIVREIRQAKAKHGIEWVVVDYLQRVDHRIGNGDKRAVELSQISNTLADCALKYNLSVLALSQLKRIEGRKPRRPYISDLKESGTIEQDAYTIIFVNRPGKDQPTDEWPADKAEIIIAKNKNGPLMDILCRFIPETMSFEPWYSTEPFSV